MDIRIPCERGHERAERGQADIYQHKKLSSYDTGRRLTADDYQVTIQFDDYWITRQSNDWQADRVFHVSIILMLPILPLITLSFAARFRILLAA
jgi:hypothetical protein